MKLTPIFNLPPLGYHRFIPHIPNERHDKMCKEGIVEDRVYLATAPHLEHLIQWQLATSEEIVQKTLAYNEDIHISTLHYLTRDGSLDVLRLVASRSEIDKHIQPHLAQHEDKQVKENLLNNENVFADIKAALEAELRSAPSPEPMLKLG